MGEYIISIFQREKRCKTRCGILAYPVLCLYKQCNPEVTQFYSFGCQLNGIYLGIWVYADYIVLLSPSRAGLQFMTNMCEHYASEHNLKFSTNANIAKSKTKCMIFSDPIINTANICPIMLNGMPLPYLNELNKLSKDCISKRAKFIS